MKEQFMGKTKTHEFSDYLVLGLSKDWLKINNGEPLEFDVTLTKGGKLVLATRLTELAKTNGSNNEVM